MGAANASRPPRLLANSSAPIVSTQPQPNGAGNIGGHDMSEDAISNAEQTPPKVIGKPFQPGQVANPKGRPKGSRNKLGEAFIQDLYSDWQENGLATIETVRAERPHEYLKVVASILPKEVKIERMDDMSDDDITKRIRRLADELGVALGFVEGVGGPSGSAEETQGQNKALPIPTLQ
jgi:hypothetical protein